MPASLVLIGGGGHAVVVAEAACMAGVKVAGFLDDDPSAALGLLPFRLPHPFPVPPHLGGLGDLGRIEAHEWIIALGDLARRRAMLGALGEGGYLADRLGGEHPTCVIHPAATVSPSSQIGLGAFVAPEAVVHARARVGAHAIINTGSIVEHDCVVGENSHVAPGAVLGGAVAVGTDVLVGLGSRVLPGVKIGDGAVVGAGAVVIRDVPEGARVAGVPARAIRGGRAG